MSGEGPLCDACSVRLVAGNPVTRLDRSGGRRPLWVHRVCEVRVLGDADGTVRRGRLAVEMTYRLVDVTETPSSRQG